MSEQQEEPELYMTYKGMGVTPFIGGIPLFLALGLMGAGIAAMGFLIADQIAIFTIIILAVIAIFLFMRVQCENNNKAPQVLLIKIKGFINVIKYGKIIKVDSGVEDNHEKRKRFQRGFKQLFKS